MAKHNPTICRKKRTNCLSLFDHFVGLALKGLTHKQYQLSHSKRQNESDTRVLELEFNSSHSSLQQEIIFIDFVHISSLFVRSSNITLALKSTIQQGKLS